MSGSRFLGSDMRDPEVIPYFTWDAPLRVREIHQLLAAQDAESFRLLGKILREARDTDVWAFASPGFVAAHWQQLKPHLGRRLAFWEWLLKRLREEGHLAT